MRRCHYLGRHEEITYHIAITLYIICYRHIACASQSVITVLQHYLSTYNIVTYHHNQTKKPPEKIIVEA